jgi:hypothetical protein
MPLIESAKSLDRGELKFSSVIGWAQQVFSKETDLPVNSTGYFNMAAGPRLGLGDFWEIGGVAGLGMNFLGFDVKREVLGYDGIYAAIDLSAIIHTQYFQSGALLLYTLEFPGGVIFTPQAGISAVKGFNTVNSASAMDSVYFMPSLGVYFDAGAAVTFKAGEMKGAGAEGKSDIRLGLWLMYRKEITGWNVHSFMASVMYSICMKEKNYDIPEKIMGKNRE